MKQSEPTLSQAFIGFAIIVALFLFAAFLQNLESNNFFY